NLRTRLPRSSKRGMPSPRNAADAKEQAARRKVAGRKSQVVLERGAALSRAIKSFAFAAVAFFALAAAASFAAHGPLRAFRSGSRATVTPPSGNAPGALCRAQRNAMGGAAFSQLWFGRANAARGGMRKCVAYMKSADTLGTAATVEHGIMRAVATCKADRRNHPAAFRRRFGVNTRSSNALGKCIRGRSNLSARKAGR